MKPGIYRDLSYDEYAKIPAVRSSDLKGFARSAAHARYEMLHPSETPALVLGQALHVAILEPAKFDETYVSAPECDRRTKDGKATWEAFQSQSVGKIILRADEMRQCIDLARAAQDHPLARGMLDSPGANEVTLVWQDEGTGLLCKSRLDRLCNYDSYSTIVDVKTTRDASQRAFAADAARFGYHVQAAWYLRGADALAPVARRFVFLAIEKEPPHCVACYELDEAFLSAGQAECDRALRAYANAQETGVWPGYPLRLGTLFAPTWLRTPEETEP